MTMTTNLVGIGIPASRFHAHPPMQQTMVGHILTDHELRLVGPGPVGVMHLDSRRQRMTKCRFSTHAMDHDDFAIRAKGLPIPSRLIEAPVLVPAGLRTKPNLHLRQHTVSLWLKRDAAMQTYFRNLCARMARLPIDNATLPRTECCLPRQRHSALLTDKHLYRTRSSATINTRLRAESDEQFSALGARLRVKRHAAVLATSCNLFFSHAGPTSIGRVWLGSDRRFHAGPNCLHFTSFSSHNCLETTIFSDPAMRGRAAA